MATTGFNLENQDLSLLGLESDNRDSELERDVPFTCVSAAKPCDVTPSDSLKDHFGSGAIEEMNISGEHPVSLLSLDVATVRLRLGNLGGTKENMTKIGISSLKPTWRQFCHNGI